MVYNIYYRQFLRGLKNKNIRNKLIIEVDDLNFHKIVENVVVLHNAESEISEFKHKNFNVNKVACTKNLQPMKFQNCSEKQDINNHAIKAHSEVNKGKSKFITFSECR